MGASRVFAQGTKRSAPGQEPVGGRRRAQGRRPGLAQQANAEPLGQRGEEGLLERIHLRVPDHEDLRLGEPRRVSELLSSGPEQCGSIRETPLEGLVVATVERSEGP